MSLGRLSTKSDQQDNIESADENPSQLGEFPGEILLKINDHLPSMKDKAHAASVSINFHSFFQLGIEMKAAKEAAEYAINPTEKI